MTAADAKTATRLRADSSHCSFDRRLQNPPNYRCSSHLCLPSLLTTESAFHIAKFAPNFRSTLFSFLENVFHIMKFNSYLIEK